MPPNGSRNPLGAGLGTIPGISGLSLLLLFLGFAPLALATMTEGL
ncbi:MAG TPA: hypothetical protein VFG81_12245 [Anaerolineales bacterium]|nr:hypothetical protein [Anaerolineales bacterium]